MSEGDEAPPAEVLIDEAPPLAEKNRKEYLISMNHLHLRIRENHDPNIIFKCDSAEVDGYSEVVMRLVGDDTMGVDGWGLSKNDITKKELFVWFDAGYDWFESRAEFVAKPPLKQSRSRNNEEEPPSFKLRTGQFVSFKKADVFLRGRLFAMFMYLPPVSGPGKLKSLFGGQIIIFGICYVECCKKMCLVVRSARSHGRLDLSRPTVRRSCSQVLHASQGCAVSGCPMAKASETMPGMQNSANMLKKMWAGKDAVGTNAIIKDDKKAWRSALACMSFGLNTWFEPINHVWKLSNSINYCISADAAPMHIRGEMKSLAISKELEDKLLETDANVGKAFGLDLEELVLVPDDEKLYKMLMGAMNNKDPLDESWKPPPSTAAPPAAAKRKAAASPEGGAAPSDGRAVRASRARNIAPASEGEPEGEPEEWTESQTRMFLSRTLAELEKQATEKKSLNAYLSGKKGAKVFITFLNSLTAQMPNLEAAVAIVPEWFRFNNKSLQSGQGKNMLKVIGMLQKGHAYSDYGPFGYAEAEVVFITKVLSSLPALPPKTATELADKEKPPPPNPPNKLAKKPRGPPPELDPNEQTEQGGAAEANKQQPDLQLLKQKIMVLESHQQTDAAEIRRLSQEIVTLRQAQTGAPKGSTSADGSNGMSEKDLNMLGTLCSHAWNALKDVPDQMGVMKGMLAVAKGGSSDELKKFLVKTFPNSGA